jgi:hypothetical protein
MMVKPSNSLRTAQSVISERGKSVNGSSSVFRISLSPLSVVGGCGVLYGNLYLARRRERLEFRAACRLVAAELQDNSLIVEFALKKRLWWRSDEELTTEEWKQYKSVLAAGLPYDALGDLKFAVRGVRADSGDERCRPLGLRLPKFTAFCELSAVACRSETVALCYPIMPVADGIGG